MNATPPEQADPTGSPAAPVEQSSLPAPPPPRCQDCGSVLTGRYCAECGQRAGAHVLTMHEVAHDVVHSALHLDSRVWRTLGTLVLHPGALTNEFIAGRRQRYLPPFRLYLVLSVLFFALSAVLPGTQIVHAGPGGETVIALGPATPEGEQRAPETSKDECNIQIDGTLGKRVSPLLAEACAKVMADGGRRLVQVFFQNAPKLMFLFLPLMAAVAMLFYWKPRRLYAEHLVMFLHVHAMVFLTLSVTSMLNGIATLDLPGVGLLGFVTFVLMLYLPWYVFRAMRVVYGQGRLLTGVKFVTISLFYFVLLGITLLGGMLYSAMTL